MTLFNILTNLILQIIIGKGSIVVVQQQQYFPVEELVVVKSPSYKGGGATAYLHQIISLCTLPH